MNVLTRAAGEAWMASRHYDFIPSIPYHDAYGNWRQGAEGHVEISAGWHVTSFSVTVQTDGATLLHLADRIVRWLGEQEVLLWITVFNTSSSDEDFRLFTNFTASEGIGDFSPDYKCFLTNLRNFKDRSALERVLLLMSALNWEGFVLSEKGTSMVWMADEIIKLATNQREMFEKVEAIVADLGFQALRPDFYWWNAGVSEPSRES